MADPTNPRDLIKAATPPDKWTVWRYQNGGGRVSRGDRLIADFYHEEEREFFLAAAAAYPALLDAAEALRKVTEYSWGLHLAGTPNEAEAISLIEQAREALARLKETTDD